MRIICSQGAPASAAQAKSSLITSRRQLIAWTVTGLAAPSCLCCPPAPANAASAPPAEWSYGDPEGISQWGGTCSTGKFQSPIDIPLPDNKSAIPSSNFGLFRPRYPRFVKEGATVRNNGHGSPQINFPDGFGLEVGNQTYSLVQLHFHAASEHAVNGKHAPLECHLVHKNDATGELAVVAILMTLGAANPVLQTALRAAPTAPDNVIPLSQAISLRSLLPPPISSAGGRRYVTYEGSLTTPPCSERVRWFVLLDHVPVSPQQVLALMEFGSSGATLQLNERPLQPLNNRTLEYCL